MDKEDVKQALMALDDSTPEGAVAAAKLMRTRLREVFADEQRFNSNASLNNTALCAQAYVKVSDFIARHEKRSAPRQLRPSL